MTVVLLQGLPHQAGKKPTSGAVFIATEVSLTASRRGTIGDPFANRAGARWVKTMIPGECVLKIIADADDREDIAIRALLVIALKEGGIDFT